MQLDLTKIFKKKNSKTLVQNTISPVKKGELINPGLEKMEKYLTDLSKSISKKSDK